MTCKLMVLAVAGLVTAGAFGVPGSVLTEKGETKGDVNWSVRNKCYVVTQKKGKTTMDVEVQADEVTGLDIEKPQGWDAQAAAAEKGGTSGTAYFTKVMKDYAHLQWDMQAARYLAVAYLAAKNTDKALDVCKMVVQHDPTAAYRGALAPAYWQCLIAMNRKSELEKALAKAAQSGDRFSSGSALIARGDLIRAGGDSNDALKAALTDGYLRVVLMYTDSDVAPQVRPEALYKAAKCFEKLGQPARADAMRSELKRSYGASPWASK